MANLNLNTFSDIILPKSMQKTYKCDWCQKPLPKRYFVHKNIGQEVSEHRFCSRDCKTSWCSNLSKKA
ncbi:MAG: hypothetical protein ACTSWX_06635 [Promethearchaeota archaeon]